MLSASFFVLQSFKESKQSPRPFCVENADANTYSFLSHSSNRVSLVEAVLLLTSAQVSLIEVFELPPELCYRVRMAFDGL